MKYDHPLLSETSSSHTLLLSCPNEGGLLALNEGQISIVDCVDTMGLFVEGNTVIRAYQTAAQGQLDIFTGEAMRTVTLSEVSDLHDICLAGGRLHAVSTGTNEVLVYDLEGQLANRIAFPGGPDSWHLNCLTQWEGELAFSAFGQFHGYRGWSEGRSHGNGFVAKLDDGQMCAPILTGLDQPHTPREHQGRLYCCDSRNQALLRVTGSMREEIHFAHYFPRGLAFCGDTAYLGLSASRDHSTKGAIAVIDLRTFTEQARIEVPFGEIYDLVSVTQAQLAAIQGHYGRAARSRHSLCFQAATSLPLDRLPTELLELRAEVARYQDKIARMKASFSWRCTSPLRALRRGWQALGGKTVSRSELLKIPANTYEGVWVRSRPTPSFTTRANSACLGQPTR